MQRFDDNAASATTHQRNQKDRRDWHTKNTSLHPKLNKMTALCRAARIRHQNKGQPKAREYTNLIDTDPAVVTSLVDLALMSWSPDWRKLLRDNVKAISELVMDSVATFNFDKICVFLASFFFPLIVWFL